MPSNPDQAGFMRVYNHAAGLQSFFAGLILLLVIYSYLINTCLLQYKPIANPV